MVELLVNKNYHRWQAVLQLVVRWLVGLVVKEVVKMGWGHYDTQLKHAQSTGQGTGAIGGIAKLLNIKRAFADAQRVLQIKDAMEGKREAAQMASQERIAGINADGTRQDINIYQTDPITGEVNLKGTAPYGSKVYKGILSPDQMKERALGTGQAKAIEKDIESTAKLSNAVKRLGILNKQYKEAFPSGDKTPFEQRISGGVGSWAVKKGLYNNPKFLALQKNIRPIAINLVRMFGEVGNLSESEQKGAIDVVNQAGLTDDERIASTKQFIEFALAGASPAGIKYIKENRGDIQGILDSMGVDIDSLSGGSGDMFSADDERRLQELEKKMRK